MARGLIPRWSTAQFWPQHTRPIQPSRLFEDTLGNWKYMQKFQIEFRQSLPRQIAHSTLSLYCKQHKEIAILTSYSSLELGRHLSIDSWLNNLEKEKNYMINCGKTKLYFGWSGRRRCCRSSQTLNEKQSSFIPNRLLILQNWVSE